MSKAMKTYISKVRTPQIRTSPLNQTESSPSYLSTPRQESSMSTSSVFVITGAVEPFLPIQGLCLARHGVRAAEALSLPAQWQLALELPSTAPGPTPETRVETSPPCTLQASAAFPCVISPELPSSRRPRAEAPPQALLTRHKRTQLLNPQPFLLGKPAQGLTHFFMRLLDASLCGVTYKSRTKFSLFTKWH